MARPRDLNTRVVRLRVAYAAEFMVAGGFGCEMMFLLRPFYYLVKLKTFPLSAVMAVFVVVAFILVLCLSRSKSITCHVSR